MAKVNITVDVIYMPTAEIFSNLIIKLNFMENLIKDLNDVTQIFPNCCTEYTIHFWKTFYSLFVKYIC